MSEPINEHYPSGHETPVDVSPELHPFVEEVGGNHDVAQQIEQALAEHGSAPAQQPASADATVVPNLSTPAIDHAQFEQAVPVQDTPIQEPTPIPIPQPTPLLKDSLLKPIKAVQYLFDNLLNPEFRQEGIKKRVGNTSVGEDPIIRQKLQQKNAS
jgi:hypothetical protein